MERVTHEFQPVFNRDSRVLILGTFPSVKSRQQQPCLRPSPEPVLEGDGGALRKRYP